MLFSSENISGLVTVPDGGSGSLCETGQLQSPLMRHLLKKTNRQTDPNHEAKKHQQQACRRPGNCQTKLIGQDQSGETRNLKTIS